MEIEKSSKMNLKVASNVSRNRYSAWTDARVEFDNIKEVAYRDLGRVKEKKLLAEHVIAEVDAFLEETIKGGGKAALAADKFIVDYDLRCNIDGPARYGSIECLSFAIDWERHPVMVRCGNIGVLRDVPANADLLAIVKVGKVRDLIEFATLIGLESVQNADVIKVHRLLPLFQVALCGQSKLTRLVKGCLMYLDHLRSGPKKYEGYSYSTLSYTVEDLIRTDRYSHAAYVFAIDENSSATSAILHAMCEKYPHPIMGGVSHISVPADGKSIFVVGYDLDKCAHSVIVSAELIWDTLIRYADHFRLGPDLDRAMIIACSLYENRYMSVVLLPRVVSKCDLVWPAQVRYGDGVTGKTSLNVSAAKVLGRFHQMLNFLIFKDLEVSVSNATTSLDWSNRELRSLITRDLTPLMSYMDDKSVSNVLKVTREMLWMDNMSDREMDRLRRISVFEALWTVRYAKEVLKDGVIKCLKKGQKHSIGISVPGWYFDTFPTLVHETQLGSSRRLEDIPNGGYNVRFARFKHQERVSRSISFSDPSKMPSQFTYGDNGLRKAVSFGKACVVSCASKDHESSK